MKAKLGNEAGMQCKPNEFLLQLTQEIFLINQQNNV